MDNDANVSRIGQSMRRFGSAVANWLADSLSLSGDGRAVMLHSLAQQYQPHPTLRMSSRDRSDLRSMKASHRFGPADL